MKIGVTIKIRDYENIKIETSEYESLDLCMGELYEALRKLNHMEAVKDFKNYMFPSSS